MREKAKPDVDKNVGGKPATLKNVHNIQVIKCKIWYHVLVSNQGPLDPQSSALTN
jgi:hypothetical protein